MRHTFGPPGGWGGLAMPVTGTGTMKPSKSCQVTAQLMAWRVRALDAYVRGSRAPFWGLNACALADA